MQERFHDTSWEGHGQSPFGGAPSASGSGGDNLDRLRDLGRAHAEAGDDGIDRAVSGDSVKFNNSNRQTGGQ